MTSKAVRVWVVIAALLLVGCSTTTTSVGSGTKHKPEFQKTCGMDGYCAIWKLNEAGKYEKCASRVPADPDVKAEEVECDE